MYHCKLCGFDVEQDDIAVMGTNGNCICLHCFARETNTEKPLSTTLRKEATQALEEGAKYG